MLKENLESGTNFYILYGMNVTSEYIEKYKNLTGDDLYGIVLDENSTTSTRIL